MPDRPSATADVATAALGRYAGQPAAHSGSHLERFGRRNHLAVAWRST